MCLSRTGEPGFLQGWGSNTECQKGRSGRGDGKEPCPRARLQSASPWQPMWALGGSLVPGSCPHSALSVVYLKVLQGWGCPGGKDSKGG